MQARGASRRISGWSEQLKVFVDSARGELKEEADTTAAKSAGQVKASERGFSLQSADGKNQIKLRGVLHVDGRSMISDEEDLPDSFQVDAGPPDRRGYRGRDL